MKNLKDIAYKLLFAQNPIAQEGYLYERSIDVPHIFVERNTGSIVAGVDDTIRQIERYFKDDADFVLIQTSSFGISSFDPVVGVQVPGRALILFKNVKFNVVNTILDSILNHILPDNDCVIAQIANQGLSLWPDVPQLFDCDFFRLQKRRVLKDFGFVQPDSIESYFKFGGYSAFSYTITKKTPLEVCTIIEKSKLRGRGGGAYYTGKKWRDALNTGKFNKYFVCNADESDPGSFSGRLIAENNPHLLIEGLLIGAYAIGASKAYIYIRNTYSLAIMRLEKALEQVKMAGLSGEDIFGSGIDIDIEIFKGPGAYVCGEETALISSMEGERGTPKPKPPYPTQEGLFGMPTVVNNIETICNVPWIMNNGLDKFLETGFKDSFGTKLFSVSGKTDKTGVFEMDMGTKINDILGFCVDSENYTEIKAVHLGGPSGGFVDPADFDLNLDYETMSTNNLWLGAGSFLVLDQTNCIIDITKYFIRFINNESCGKCIPCREGSQRLLEILERISEKPHENDKHESLLRFKGVTQLEQISFLMQKTSLCGLGQNAPNTILSGLSRFRQEYEEHIYERKCVANVCRNLKEYFVNIDNCVGCGICAKKCPSDAIIGSNHHAHFIVQDRCIKCGICESVCKFNAIMVK